MDATTTLYLTPKLRDRIHALARQAGRSPHSIIVEAVERHVEFEEQMRGLVREALDTEAELETTAEACRAEDVHAWLDRLKVGVRSMIALSRGEKSTRAQGGAAEESE